MKDIQEELAEVQNVPSEVRRIAHSLFQEPTGFPSHFSVREIHLYTDELLPESGVSASLSDS